MCLKITCIIFHKIFHLNHHSKFNGRVAENLEFKSFMSCKVTKTGNIHNCFWAQSNAFPLAEPSRSPRSSKKVVSPLTEPANSCSLSGHSTGSSPQQSENGSHRPLFPRPISAILFLQVAFGEDGGWAEEAPLPEKLESHCWLIVVLPSKAICCSPSGHLREKYCSE